jgi:phospholipid transport system substrate-binding protein
MISLLSRYLFIFFLAFSSFTLRAEQPNLLAPQRVIAEASVKLLAQLEDPNFSQDKKQIRHYIDQEIFPQVDTILMSALVLGKHWRKASKMQQREFIRAFKQLLVNTYAATFTEQFHNWTIRYSPLKLKDSDKKILVKTRVRQAGKPDTRIDYSMVLRKGEWKIYDMTVEGISLIISNRTIFGKMIKDSGSLENVIKNLKEKNKASEESNALPKEQT